jgi:hypothetical protein
MIGRCKEDKDTISTKVSSRKDLWNNKWKNELNPLQPVKPKTTPSTSVVVENNNTEEANDQEFEQVLKAVRENSIIDNTNNKVAQV